MMKEIIKEITSAWRAYLAEFLATYIFVFISLTAAVVDLLFLDLGTLSVVLISGFIYTALVWSTAHLSGGFLNPAITLSFWFSGKLHGGVAFFYMTFQILASIFSVYTVWLLFGSSVWDVAFGLQADNWLLDTQSASIIEAIFSATVVFVAVATVVDKHGPVGFGPLIVGIAVTACTMLAMPLSGGSVNPIKFLGAGILTGSFSQLLVWVGGPMVGSLVGLVYDFAFMSKRKK